MIMVMMMVVRMMVFALISEFNGVEFRGHKWRCEMDEVMETISSLVVSLRGPSCDFIPQFVDLL